MKRPKYFVENSQQAITAGINPFALTLLAESFADNPERFGDENVVLLAHAHNGQEVWFIMTKTRPKGADFDEHPSALHSTEPPSTSEPKP